MMASGKYEMRKEVMGFHYLPFSNFSLKQTVLKWSALSTGVSRGGIFLWFAYG